MEKYLHNGKLKWEKYSTVSFSGGKKNIKILMYEDNIFIPQKLQIHVVHLYHKYLRNTVIDKTNSVTFQ